MLKKSPQNETFADGVATFYKKQNVAEPGCLPKTKQVKKLRLCYQQRTVGVQRNYLAHQNQEHIDAVIRTQRVAGLSVLDAVTLNGDTGHPYRIRQIQLTNSGGESVQALPTMDISLERWTTNDQFA